MTTTLMKTSLDNNGDKNVKEGNGKKLTVTDEEESDSNGKSDHQMRIV